ncbi:MAG: Mn2+ and Fe2+ transporter of the family [Candidatus Angelobacter sp.]|jgi:Mn2+/Fe2+ NRAMP family transporter|nr:Mn2+ and Fe2+ transporter of the family [Candidatus Angelobacter sp.]
MSRSSRKTCGVNFPRFNNQNRSGSADDRGKVLNFPQTTPAPEARRPESSLLQRLGPGLVTGCSDVDPSCVVTATVAGAAFGHSLLWVVVLCFPFLLAIFSAAGRIGTQTCQGLLELVRERYSRRLAIAGAIFAIITNLAVVIADLMAVSDAFSILTNQSRMYFVAATAFFVWYILVFQDYRKITRILVIFSLPLYVYVIAAILTKPNIGQLLMEAFIPRSQPTVDFIENVVAIFGSLLTPYIIIWHASSRTEPGHEHDHADSTTATLIAFGLASSIMIAASAVLHLPHPVDMTTKQAAEALRPAVGPLGPVVFAIGIIGSGLVALPVLTASMCYDLAQAIGWKYGLSENPWEARRFYVLISAAMLVATLANFFPINPVKALYWSMILAGILLIPTLIFIVVISNDRRIMRTTSTMWENFWVGAAAGGAAAAGLIYLRLKFF